MKITAKDIKTLLDNKVTMQRLAVLIACDEPVAVVEIMDAFNISRRMLEKWINESDGLIQYCKTNSRGDHKRHYMAAIKRTEKAEKLIANFLK